jgi:pimeloyl-ACP methyl ester carboxylesterase
MRFELIPTNGIRLHTALAGPENGEPVILLHGFPEAWFGWEAQIGPLAEAGFRVIVPDQRGYNLSDKPPGVAGYRMPALVADIVGLADSLGYERFSLAGHDWGGMVGWSLALKHPDRLRRLAIANAPHPAVMGRFLRSQPAQMLKSWYMFVFQLPSLPELVVKAANWRILMAAMPNHLTEPQRQRYRQAWAQPGAMTAMINWYRASLRRSGGRRRASSGGPRGAAGARVRVPALLIWGQQDPHMSRDMAPLSVELCNDGRLVSFPDATHWVQHDEADEVSRLLTEHFSGGGQDDD